MIQTNDALGKAFGKMELSAARYHAFLCLGPKCCSGETGQQTWEALKRLIRETGAPVLRTKADCLRVCMKGPVMVVYPDGVWYTEVSPERCERIVREHFLGGKPVEEWVAAQHPLDWARFQG